MTPWRLYITVFLIISFSFRLIRLVTAIRKARGEGHGITTARPIFWVMTGSYLLFFGIGGWEALRQPMPQEWGISLFGLLLYVSALLLRERAMFDLGRFFSPDIEIRKGHRVVREGLYGWVRHPLLLCLIVEVMGLGLLLNAFATLLVLGGCLYLPIIVIRKQIEEGALLKQLGEDYRLYQREVGALFPRWQSFLGIYRRFIHA